MDRIEQSKHEESRLRRQMLAMSSGHPRLRGLLERLLHNRMRWVRIPLGLLLILGGIFSILPVLGAWMLPVGLGLLAVDVPVLRRPVSRMIVVGKRSWRRWRGSRTG